MLNSDKSFKDLIAILEKVHSGIDYYTQEDLWEKAIFDSLELMSLISLIEKDIGFTFSEAELVPDTFYSAKTIWEVITRK